MGNEKLLYEKVNSVVGYSDFIAAGIRWQKFALVPSKNTIGI